MKIVVISGGSGYIGQSLAVGLMKKGYRVINIDRDLKGSLLWNNINYDEIVCDLSYEINTDVYNQLAEANKGDEFYGFIHLAAWKDLTGSYDNPYEYYRNNIQSTITACYLAHVLGCKVFLNASSAGVYPDDAVGMTKESDATYEKCASPYGNAKFICERIVTEICLQYKIRSHNLRYANPIGCNNYNSIDMSTSMFGNILNSISNNTDFIIFGGDYATKDGTPIRDYLDMRDLVDAHIFLLERTFFESYNRFEILNIGTGVPTSCLDVCKYVNEKVDRFHYEIGGRREGDAAGSVEDISLMNKLGWKPKYDYKSSFDNLYKMWCEASNKGV